MEGIATIKLENVKTGEIKEYVEHNIITGIVPNIIKTNPANMLSYPAAAQDLFGGIMLSESEITETTENWDKIYLPVAMCGNGSSSAEGISGTLSLKELDKERKQLKQVWYWNTSQGNGKYNCITLTNPLICNYNNRVFYGKNGDTNGVIFKKQNTVNNYWRDAADGNNDEIIFYVDRDNNLMYTFTLDSLTQGTIRKRQFGIDKLYLWQSAMANPTRVDAPERASRIIDEQVITFSSMNFSNQTVDAYITASLNYDKKTNELFIITINRYSGIVYYIKLDLNDFSNIVKTETKVDYSNYLNNNGLRWSFYHVGDSTRQHTYRVKTDTVPMNDNYFYIQAHPTASSGHSVYIKIGKSDFTIASGGVIDMGFFMSNLNNGLKIKNHIYYYNTHYENNSNGRWIFDTESEVFKKIAENNVADTDSITSGLTRLFAVTDEYVIAYSPAYDNTAVDIYINPFYLATINNITEITKTNEQTMTISYVLKE
jgi:hypothetical protein